MTNREETLKNFEPMIHKLACSYLYKLPQCSYQDLDDLKQECRIALNAAIDSYDESKGNLFSYGYEKVKGKLANLLRTENYEKRKYDALQNIDIETLHGSQMSPDRFIMLLEFLGQCTKISPEFVDMIINGPTEALLLAERRARRARLRRRNDKRESATNTPLKFPKSLIENYFNLKVKKIQVLYYNSID